MKLPPGLFKRGKSRVVLSLALLLVMAGGLGAWFAFRPTETAQAADITQTVAKETLSSTVSVSGTLAAASAADLDFTQSGTVTKVLVGVGDTVRKNQALATIDKSSLAAAQTAAESAYEAARAQYDELVDDSADDVQVAAAQSAQVAAKDALDEADEALAGATLRSTIAGTVTALDLAVGDVVSGSSSSSSGGASSGGSAMGGTSTATSTSAVRVVAPGTFTLDATVAAAQVEKVKTGQQVTLTVTGVTENVFGTVSEVGRVAETGSGGAAVFPVTIKVTGTRDDLYPGTSATAAITVEQRTDVLAVNTRALTTTDGKTTVTVRRDGTDTTVEVTTGDTFGTSTEVTKGLAEGDVVVLPGFTGMGGGGTRGSGGSGPAGGGSGGSGGSGDQGGMPSMPEGFSPPSGGFPGGMGGN